MQIDKVCLMAPCKAGIRQFLRQLSQRLRSSGMEQLLFCVVAKSMVLHFHIENLFWQKFKLPLPAADQDRSALPGCQDFANLIQLCGKRIILNRLQHIIQRTDRVALNRILGQSCDENDKYIWVSLPNLPCGVHAVQKRHFNIQQDQVPYWAVAGNKLHSILKTRISDLYGMLCFIAFQICLQNSAVCVLILYNGNTHETPRFP